MRGHFTTLYSRHHSLFPLYFDMYHRFQVIRCVSETLAGQNDQVQSIAENAEERHDR